MFNMYPHCQLRSTSTISISSNRLMFPLDLGGGLGTNGASVVGIVTFCRNVLRQKVENFPKPIAILVCLLLK